jgi:putative redox protein
VKCVVTGLDLVASQVTLGEHTLTFDQPPSVPNGLNRGPSPLDVMLASIGACAHYFAAAFLSARNIPTQSLSVTVEAAKEAQPFPHLEELRISIGLPPGTPERYLPAIERAVNNCPALGTLRQPTHVELTFAQQGAGE